MTSLANRTTPGAAALALTLGLGCAAAQAQSADLRTWAAAGDTVIDAAGAARLTTAAVESGETPLSATSALLYFDLEPVLGLVAGTLPGDTFEGSGLALGFTATAPTTIAFDWSLATTTYDADYADIFFIALDGGSFERVASVGAASVAGHYGHTFDSGAHAFAFGVLDVNSTDLVSALSVRNFSVAGAVAAVPEPGTYALMALGLAAMVAQRRRR